MSAKKISMRFITATLIILCLFTCSITPAAYAKDDPHNTVTPPDKYIPAPTSIPPKLTKAVPNINNTNVLLIEDSLPWKSNANSMLLSSLGVKYKKVATDSFLSEDLGNYSILIFANDQSTISYSNYITFMDRVETFAELGGIVVFGACDGGWANGNMQTLLPGGVVPLRQYSNNNYIANATHPIVTGELSGGSRLNNSDLYAVYCSHASFRESSLPANSKIILRDSVQNAPSLVEYPLGQGTIIASGLTWEHNYIITKTFAPKAMDDLFLYAISLRIADVNMRPPLALSVIAPTEIGIENNILTPNPFEITANIQNIGNATSKNVQISLDTFSAFEIVAGDPVIHLGDVLQGERVSVTWKAKVELGVSGKNAPFKIRLTSDNSDTKDFSREITIPSRIASGTAEDPHGIGTAEDLSDMAQNLNGHYVLTEDIDLGENSTFTAIGKSTAHFKGTLDGNGHTIKNLSSPPAANYFGLFAYTTNATIKNLILEDVNLQGNSNIAAISAVAAGTTVIENCIVTGSVQGNSNIAGIVASTTGKCKIINCQMFGTVSGGNYTGGIIGKAKATQILENKNSALISGTSYVGGIVGRFDPTGTITDCENFGQVKGTSSHIGGIVGYFYKSTDISDISNVKNYGNITGFDYVGGIVGSLSPFNLSIIKNYISEGTVTGTKTNFGPLAGNKK